MKAKVVRSKGKRVTVWAVCGLFCAGAVAVDTAAAIPLLAMFGLFSGAMFGGVK